MLTITVKMHLLLFQINHLGPDLSSLVMPISVLVDKDCCCNTIWF